MPRSRRLILVGGGHAHVEVLRSAARSRFEGEIVLVTPYPELLYSRTLPRMLRGDADESASRLDLRALCDAANVRLVEAFAERVSADAGGVVVHTRAEPVPGDLCSLDVGSLAGGTDVPGMRDHAYAVRPQSRWRALVALVDEVMRTPGTAPVSCCVVGGGAAGVELALALLARARSARQPVTMTLVEASEDVLMEMGPRAAARARGILRRHGVRVETGRAVTGVTADSVTLADGTRVESALTVWTAGAAAPPLARASGLPVDADGYLRVDSALRATNGVPVYGAGDCIALADAPWMPRSLAYAERQAPVLAHNLRAMMCIPPAEPRLYEPRPSALALLDTSDDRGLLYWRGMHSHSRLALRLKRWIDRRFVERYRTTPPLPSPPSDP